MKSLFRIADALGRGPRAGTKPDELGYMVGKSHDGKHNYAVFVLGNKLVESMRWIIGDRIDILYDSAMAEGQLVRCKDGGWALTGKNARTFRVRIAMRPQFELPIVEHKIDLALETTQNTITFAFPTQYRKQKQVDPGQKG